MSREILLKHFKPPFKNDGFGYIFDSNNKMILEMRGYGNISSSLNYDEEETYRQQDKIAEYLVECLNEGFEVLDKSEDIFDKIDPEIIHSTTMDRIKDMEKEING